MGILIGIDIGSSSCKVVVMSEAGGVLGQHSITYPRKGEITDVLDQLPSIVSMYRSVNDVRRVGVCAPGPLDRKAGVVLNTPNFPSINNYRIVDALSSRFNVPVVLENDSNAAAYAEHEIASGKGSSVFLMFTMGTGIGGGIVINNLLVHGSGGNGGEFGHIIVDPRGDNCHCGQRGCLTRYASAKAIQDKYKLKVKEKREISARDIFDWARSRDVIAQAVCRGAVTNLAIACASLLRVFDPDIICIGGGMAVSIVDYSDILDDALMRMKNGSLPIRTKIVFSELGVYAGAVGAALLARKAE